MRLYGHAVSRRCCIGHGAAKETSQTYPAKGHEPTALRLTFLLTILYANDRRILTEYTQAERGKFFRVPSKVKTRIKANFSFLTLPDLRRVTNTADF